VVGGFVRQTALTSFDLPSFDLPSFDLPSFDMPSFDMPSFDLPSFDLPSVLTPLTASVELPNLVELPSIHMPLALKTVDLSSLLTSGTHRSPAFELPAAPGAGAAKVAFDASPQSLLPSPRSASSPKSAKSAGKTQHWIVRLWRTLRGGEKGAARRSAKRKRRSAQKAARMAQKAARSAQKAAWKAAVKEKKEAVKRAAKAAHEADDIFAAEM
jgi:hypothetical protein